MLLPALSRAKEHAYRTQCYNNYKQLLVAHMMYVGDNNDRLSGPNSGGSTTAINNDYPPGWLYKPGQALPSGTNYFGPERGNFYPNLRSWKLYMCPMDKTNNPAWAGRTIKFTSYVMSGVVCSGTIPPNSFGQGGNRDWDGGARGRTFRLTAFKMTDVLIWETDENIPNYFNDGGSSPDEGLSRRHAFGATLGLFGGSVEYIKYKKYFDLEAAPNKSSVWCFPNSDDGHW